MAEIIWTNEAESWLREIYEFIVPDNKRAANNIINEIYEQVDLLRENPEIGYKYKTTSQGPIRIILFDHYRIAYLKNNEKNIYILGVFHGALDIDFYL
jgi:plasmid stabilization system protein ParE